MEVVGVGTRENRPRRLLAIVVALSVLSLGPGAALAVSPNGPCTSSPNNYAGAEVGWVGAASAEVKIESISPLLCTTSGNPQHASLTWVAIGGATACQECIYQIGTAKCVNTLQPSSGCDGTFRLFYAWGRNSSYGGCPTVLPFPVSLGAGHDRAAPSGTNTYSVVRTTSQIQFKLNTTTQTTIGSANICWTSAAALYYGETYDSGDQLGGTVGDHQSLTNAIYERTVSGPWLSPSFTNCGSSSASYLCTRVNGQAIDLWTDRS